MGSEISKPGDPSAVSSTPPPVESKFSGRNFGVSTGNKGFSSKEVMSALDKTASAEKTLSADQNAGND